MKPGSEAIITGFLGAGKSHVLAACVCGLFKAGRDVIFLPDCERLLFDPIQYLFEALLPIASRYEIFEEDIWAAMDVSNHKEKTSILVALCRKAEEPGMHFLFVYDQTNALDEDITTEKQYSVGEKRFAQDLLDRISHSHARLSCWTRNYRAHRYDQEGLTTEVILDLGYFDELDKAEMEMFWKRYFEAAIPGKTLLLTAPQKERVDSLTGKLPYLLSAWSDIDVVTAVSSRVTTSVFTSNLVAAVDTFDLDHDGSVTSGTAAGALSRVSTAIVELKDDDFEKLISAFWACARVEAVRKHITDFAKSNLHRLGGNQLEIFKRSLIACVHGERIEVVDDEDISCLGASRFIDWRYFAFGQSLDGNVSEHAFFSCGVAQ